VTDAFLRASNAAPFADVAARLLAFVAATSGGTDVPVVFVSHGCHVLDKPVLEQEFARLHRAVPASWYFYDTLPFFRQRYRRERSYALGALFASVFGFAPPPGHRAVNDTWTLAVLLSHATFGGYTHWMTGGYYPAALTPLQTVRYVGTQTEALLHQGGVTCTEDLLILMAKTCRMDEAALGTYLERRCAVPRPTACRVAHSVFVVLLRQLRAAEVDAADDDAASAAARDTVGTASV
jgi:hypothetical protein